MEKISVPSRFACLKIEDDDYKAPTSKNNCPSKKKLENKNQNQKKPNNKGANSSSNKQSNVKVSNTKKSKTNNLKNKEWEEWKQRDSELVNEKYEQDLQNAIVQSKLDFDAKKAIAPKKDNVTKKKTMPLDQFLKGPQKEPVSEDTKDNGDDEGYFEKLIEGAKKEITKSKVEEERKEREVNIEKFLTLSQIQEQLIKEKTSNNELEKELNETKTELLAVKARNKTLCSILGQAEMREKAELILELERLNLVKDELTEEISKLHKLLEQERSKTTNLKDKKRKKTG